MKQLQKTPIKQFKKEYLEKGDKFEQFLTDYYIYQVKVKDLKEKNTNEDYIIFERLNPFNPFAYIFIIYLLLIGFAKENTFFENMKSFFNSFRWYKV